MRGIAYAGILMTLSTEFDLDFSSRFRKIEHCIGTSIGALVAVMVTIGVTPTELVKQAQSRDFTSIIDIKNFAQWTNVFKTWGLADPVPLKLWVDKVLQQKIGKRNVTFKDLYDVTKVKLTIVVTNITDNCPEYWSYETHPNTSVSDAVVTSMALPPIFPPYRAKRTLNIEKGIKCSDLSPLPLRKGDTVLLPGGKNKCGTIVSIQNNLAKVAIEEEVLYADGGIRDNFAILHAKVPMSQILGLKVTWNCSNDLSSIDKYCARVAYCALTVADEVAAGTIPTELKSRICACDVGDISGIDFDIGPSIVNELICRGKKAARKFVTGSLTRDASTQTT